MVGIYPVDLQRIVIRYLFNWNEGIFFIQLKLESFI